MLHHVSSHIAILPQPRTMNTMLGLAQSSTAIVRRLRCSTLRPLTPGLPTCALRRPLRSTSSMTCAAGGSYRRAEKAGMPEQTHCMDGQHRHCADADVKGMALGRFTCLNHKLMPCGRVGGGRQA